MQNIQEKIALFLIFFVCIDIEAQDLILFQNGTKKEVKVLEISPSMVKYKKFSSSNDVIYSEKKSKLIGTQDYIYIMERIVFPIC